jgi:hypothetical protein
MNILNEADNSTQSIGHVHVNFRVGELIEFVEYQLRNIEIGPGNYGYAFDVLKGKQWKNGFAGDLRFTEPAKASEYEGNVSGGVWYRNSDRAERLFALKTEIRNFLNNKILKTTESLRSL